MRTLQILVLAALLIAAAGCGDSGRSDEEKVDEALESLEEELAKNPPGPGLGEASPPPPDGATWRTDFSKALVSLDEFRSGGPPKDGIPAVDFPQFSRADTIDWLGNREPVIVVKVEGETRAYPLQILIWHEIVNDTVGGVPVSVTFCPLCNTAIVFDRRLDGETYDFGTTGKLRESDLVMYDRQTETWWQQFSGEALVGARAGEKLDQIPAQIMAWEDFWVEYPDAPVLNRDTGFVRDYGTNPYVGYDDIDNPPLFATSNEDDDRLPPKERVAYLELGDDAYAVPFSEFARTPRVTFDTPEGEVDVRWSGGVASALDGVGIASGRAVGTTRVTLDGRPVPFHEPFWFAVAAFRPDVEIVRG
jgi:hypothetical protein